jgi:Family of unknown function (DUF5677)
MTTAAPGTGIDRLNDLITLDLWREVDGMNRAAVVGWGTTFHVVHLVKAVRTLHAAGQCHATVSLLRSVMEYTLGTMWLADAGEDAVDVLNRRLQYSKHKLRDDIEQHESIRMSDFPAEAVRTFMDTLAVQLTPHPDERLAAFRHLLQEYGFEKLIPVYDVISGHSHLSLEGAQEFFQNGEGAIGLTQDPRHNELMPCEDICLGMQFDTMLAYNELLRTRPWTAQLSAIAGDHGLPVRLVARRNAS